MKYVLVGLAFSTVYLFIIGVYYLLFSKRTVVKERLKFSIENQSTQNSKGKQRFTSFSSDSTFLTSLSKVGFIDKIYEKNRLALAQAHVPIRPEELFGLSLMIPAFLFLVLYLLDASFLLALFVAVLSYRLPAIVINFVKKTRARKLNNQLPEALSILSNGLRAGLSFTQAMLVASREMDEPISQEFTKIVRDNSLGKPLDEALTDFSSRTDDEDVDIFTTAILIQRQVGGNLSEILDILANTIRERVKLKGDVKTVTAQSKLSALIIGGIPFVLMVFLYISNPDFIIPLFTTVPGIIMLAIVLVLELIGVVVLMKIMEIKY